MQEFDRERDYDIINIHYHEIWIAKGFARRKVYWMMNDLPGAIHAEAIGTYPGGLIPTLYLSLTKVLTRRAVRSAVYTTIVLDYFNRGLVGRYFGTEAVVVRSGVDLASFAPRERVRRENVSDTTVFSFATAAMRM